MTPVVREVLEELAPGLVDLLDMMTREWNSPAPHAMNESFCSMVCRAAAEIVERNP